MWSRSTLLRSRYSDIPDYLLPSFANAPRPRPFSASTRSHSRIGATPLPIPDGVELTLLGPLPLRKGEQRRIEPPSVIEVGGPLGKQRVPIPPYLTFKQDAETRKAALSIQDKRVRKQREMWGTTRAVLNNHILGVSEGHSAILRFVGVGFRATVESSASTKQPEYSGQQFVSLKVGYSHPIELGVPQGVKASSPQPTRLLLEGTDKEAVMQFAAEVRAWRKPEPYKGKGIFVNGETIRLKSKKIK